MKLGTLDAAIGFSINLWNVAHEDDSKVRENRNTDESAA